MTELERVVQRHPYELVLYAVRGEPGEWEVVDWAASGKVVGISLSNCEADIPEILERELGLERVNAIWDEDERIELEDADTGEPVGALVCGNVNGNAPVGSPARAYEFARTVTR